MTRDDARLVKVDTPDGPMDVFLALAGDDPHAPCAIIYMDVFGLRDELFELARAFAADGIAAVVPDLFHRLPVSRFPPANGRDVRPEPTAIEANDNTTLAMSRIDTRALVAWLDAAGANFRPKRYFAIGFCMGGRHALAAAVALPDRVSGGMSVHGGRLVTNGAESPHHLIADLKVPFHFACARDDPTCSRAHCEILQATAAESAARVTLETVDAHHGWSFPARWSYDPAAAARIHQRACAMITVDLT
ncbi:dienelactone hydrolase family protein [Bauldia sp.]|uniref:dienelactone hydrolase family protein n=1 Tax=Bauldia sp. TaxID=2575872 RepID=UPI003BAD771A